MFIWLVFHICLYENKKSSIISVCVTEILSKGSFPFSDNNKMSVFTHNRFAFVKLVHQLVLYQQRLKVKESKA